MTQLSREGKRIQVLGSTTEDPANNQNILLLNAQKMEKSVTKNRVVEMIVKTVIETIATTAVETFVTTAAEMIATIVIEMIETIGIEIDIATTAEKIGTVDETVTTATTTMIGIIGATVTEMTAIGVTVTEMIVVGTIGTTMTAAVMTVVETNVGITIAPTTTRAVMAVVILKTSIGTAAGEKSAATMTTDEKKVGGKATTLSAIVDTTVKIMRWNDSHHAAMKIMR